MTADEILAAVFGGLVLISLIVLCIIGIKSAEKTEEYKREFLIEATKYLKERNKMFNKEDE